MAGVAGFAVPSAPQLVVGFAHGGFGGSVIERGALVLLGPFPVAQVPSQLLFALRYALVSYGQHLGATRREPLDQLGWDTGDVGLAVAVDGLERDPQAKGELGAQGGVVDHSGRLAW
jgi:hypothetical protein